MQHTYQRDRTRSQRASVEWVQAFTTLGVLLLIFAAVQDSSLVSSATEDKESVSYESNPYWNESLGYGFQGNNADAFTPLYRTENTEKLAIQEKDGEIYRDSSVRVSYYRAHTIDEIEKDIPTDSPRSYSRLPGGIAVIEGDLSSERAKLVLATLHSR